MDTGANVSLISKKLYDDLPKDSKPTLTPCMNTTLAGNSSPFVEHGKAVFTLQIDGISVTHEFRVGEMDEPGNHRY